MMRNVNQWCGVFALIAIGCLLAFGSAGERVVTAANGQLSQAGDTGTAIAIGGCNRCAWETKYIGAQVQAGVPFEIAPAGTSGAILEVKSDFTSFGPLSGFVPFDGPPPNGRRMFKNLLMIVTGQDGQAAFLSRTQPEAGFRFHDGLFLVPSSTHFSELTVVYRVD